VGSFAFVNLDDPAYVTQNPTVRGGLSWSGVRWACTAFFAANWHPLTWVSHMADVHLFAMDAGGHHLVSLGLHAASSLLLFHLLGTLTGSLWRSAAVAALFAVHPVQVESVAWVAERKTVLAGLLGLLAVRAYLAQVARPGRHSRAVVIGLFALGLLAKPMLVVLPLLLLLIDWWPLGRFGRDGAAPGAARAALVEKAPLFALALLSGIVTLAAQSRVGAVAPLQLYPLPVRLGNALLSLSAYLGDLALPRNLLAYYEHPAASLPWSRAAAAAFALAAVTLLAWRGRRAAPYVLFGWLWYLTALLPVLGIVQVGSQARADRYLYLPLAGIFMAVAWGAAACARRRPLARFPAALSIAVACALFALAARRQAGYWRTSETLWTHALAVRPTSEMALYQLSEHYRELGRIPEQADLLRRLVRLNPRHEFALNNLGIARYRLGEKPEALLAPYQGLLAVNPRNTKALQNYGYLLLETGRHAEAIAVLEQAIELDPAYCTAINNLGRAFLASGDTPRARSTFERAVSCDPQQQKFRTNLDLAR
jgi:tetratricopeptide (TPR) repeat protein